MRLRSLFVTSVALAMAGSAAAQAPATQPASTPPATAAPVAPAIAPTVKPAPLEVPALTAENTLHLDLSTGGRVSIQLRPDLAPAHVERIKALVRQGFYNNIIFHRVIDGFMAQTGDPTGTGSGGSQLPDIAAEFSTMPHVRGAVSAARTGDPNSANSQFFIMLAPRFALDAKYSVFGRVVSGMQYVDAIAKGEPPADPSRIVRAAIGDEAGAGAPSVAPAPRPVQPTPPGQ